MKAYEELLAGVAFESRHVGTTSQEQRQMLAQLGCESLGQLIDQVVPADIRLKRELQLAAPVGEAHALDELREIAARNSGWRSFLGMGWHNTRTPPVIQRNVLENPGWYTAYTPYQAEISQGRLEAMLAFQHMTSDLTGLPVANASLLDEATAAAEAMTLMRRESKSPARAFFVDAGCHPQVVAVLRTRAKWLGIAIEFGDPERDLQPNKVFGAHLQYPDTFGRLRDPRDAIERLHAAGAFVSLGADPLALVLLESPGKLGADIAVGSAQRFGVQPGYGGPHAGFMAVREAFLRSIPGRLIGVSKDASGRSALRMALQTREQHIRREKATSNICTAQALLANIAAFYAIWHGREGLERIAKRVNFMTRLLVAAYGGTQQAAFDTVVLAPVDSIPAARQRAAAKRINLRWLESGVGVTFDETTTLDDVADVAEVLSGKRAPIEALLERLPAEPDSIPRALRRSDEILAHPVFQRYRSETEMMRYLKRLENKDLSLVHAMIPLGSCTMKLNAAAELAPLSWPTLASVHPFVPAGQAAGYAKMIEDLERALAEITGLARVSFQPNSGANGEYTGLLTLRNYHASRGEGQRDVCLIPASAHGTNPASAAMIGMKVVVIGCDTAGNVDVEDLKAKLTAHAGKVAALMITYPSTHGVFEARVREVTHLVHEAGAQVYMDGANLNALAGLATPAAIGADVCHINLHKTFCIPHGGGGPGMGPIAVASHLAPHLPGHPCLEGEAAREKNGTVSAAPHGSPLILSISWMYLRMMGGLGVRRATEAAILHANYVATRLSRYFPVLYAGAGGRVAHECILDLRTLKDECGISAEDVAKRLIDYGFHAPTLSFPVANTLMVEPTESESKAELDRFCDAMIAIHAEIARVRAGEWDRADNPLKNAPHTAQELAGEWRHGYSRETAVYPVETLRAAKYWPPVKRVDNVAGDRHFQGRLP